MRPGRTKRVFAAACLSGGLFVHGALAADLVDTARAAGKFTILLKAADAAGMTAMLRGPGPFTVFAPTDEAFQALPPGMLDTLLKPENLDKLKKVLGYHVAFGRLATTDLKDSLSSVVMTIGAPVVLKKEGNAVSANDAHVVTANVAANNGVVQVIDKVLMPATPVQPRT